MKYQLVLQFPEKVLGSFDELVALENKLITGLGASALVGGHDIGSGEANIFIITDNPQVTFEEANKIIGVKGSALEMKAAFREVSGDVYKPIWPPGLTVFRVS